jgi:hypothetical protein
VRVGEQGKKWKEDPTPKKAHLPRGNGIGNVKKKKKKALPMFERRSRQGNKKKQKSRKSWKCCLPKITR